MPSSGRIARVAMVTTHVHPPLDHRPLDVFNQRSRSFLSIVDGKTSPDRALITTSRDDANVNPPPPHPPPPITALNSGRRSFSLALLTNFDAAS